MKEFNAEQELIETASALKPVGWADKGGPTSPIPESAGKFQTPYPSVRRPTESPISVTR